MMKIVLHVFALQACSDGGTSNEDKSFGAADAASVNGAQGGVFEVAGGGGAGARGNGDGESGHLASGGSQGGNTPDAARAGSGGGITGAAGDGGNGGTSDKPCSPASAQVGSVRWRISEASNDVEPWVKDANYEGRLSLDYVAMYMSISAMASTTQPPTVFSLTAFMKPEQGASAEALEASGKVVLLLSNYSVKPSTGFISRTGKVTVKHYDRTRVEIEFDIAMRPHPLVPTKGTFRLIGSISSNCLVGGPLL